MSLAFTMTDKSINIVLDGTITTIDHTAAQFDALKYELEKGDCVDVDTVKRLMDIPRFIAEKTYGEISVNAKGVVVHHKLGALHSVLARQIGELMKRGKDIAPLSRFCDKLYANPNPEVRHDLYNWILEGGLTLTVDGTFLAFKRVNEDYTSCFDSKTRNVIGTTLEEEDVDTDNTQTCSNGLHFCSHGYLSHFSGDRTVILEIDPAFVAAIPQDYNNQKGRAYKYFVYGEVDNDLETNVLKGNVMADEVDDMQSPYQQAEEHQPYERTLFDFDDEDAIEEHLAQDNPTEAAFGPRGLADWVWTDLDGGKVPKDTDES